MNREDEGKEDEEVQLDQGRDDRVKVGVKTRKGVIDLKQVAGEVGNEAECEGGWRRLEGNGQGAIDHQK